MIRVSVLRIDRIEGSAVMYEVLDFIYLYIDVIISISSAFTPSEGILGFVRMPGQPAAPTAQHSQHLH